jgi:hypothetical protein
MNYVDRYGSVISEKALEKAVFSKNGQQGHYFQEIPCMRCGGSGGADAWKFTGWTCYRCQASTRKTKSGKFSDPKSPLKISFYTEEKLQKMEESKRKREAKKAAKKQAEYDAKWNSLMEEYSSIIETAKYYAEHNNFVGSVLETVEKNCFISEKQESALISAFATTQKWINEKNNSSNEWVGNVGERLEMELTCKSVFGPYESRFGSFYITNYKDKAGNDFVYKGAGFRQIPKGETGVIKFTVKSHDFFRDKKQTVISRLAKTKKGD